MMLRVLASSCLVMVFGGLVAAQEDRVTMVHEEVIAAPIAEVWQHFDLRDAGLGVSFG